MKCASLFFSGALALGALALSGCVSPAVVDYDRSAIGAFASYECFVIDSRERRSDYQDVVLSPIVDRRIEAAITRALTSKGFTTQCAQPDFRVTFRTITQTKTELTDLGVGPSPFARYPYFGYGGFSRLTLDQYEEGTFIIDIVDESTQQLVWRGAYSQRLGWSAPTDEEVQEIVGSILEAFPPQLAGD